MQNSSQSPEPVPLRVQCVLFDLDGTLIDSYGAIAECFNHARVRLGLPALSEGEVRGMVGHGLESLIERWVATDDIEDGVRRFRECYAEVFAGATDPLPGVEATLQRLAEGGYRMAIASNKPARFSRAILDQLGWSDWFVTVEGPDTVESTKPDPAMLQACLDALGTARARTRYVGDMPLDALSGANAGVEVVLVLGGSAAESDLRAAGPPVLAGFFELPRFLSDRGWPADPL